MATRSPKEYEQVARSLAPYPPQDAGSDPPDVLVERLEEPLQDEISERLGDTGDGLHTAWDGHGLRLMQDSAGCRLRFGESAQWAHLELEPGFAWWRAWSAAARPLLSIPIAARGAAVVHASAVVLDGEGIAIAGWAESGKTEVGLALRERGARFASDKWTALATDGTLHAMPVPAGLRAWTVPHLPELRSQLGVGQRARAAGGRLLAGAVERMGAGARGRAVTAAVGAARGAAGLASRVSLSPAALERDDEPAPVSAPLSVLVLLRAVDAPPAARELDPAVAVQRLLTTTAYERATLDQLDARSRYSGGTGVPGLAGLRTREQDVLERVLAACRVVELAAPFPADPRPAADELLSFLRRA